MDLFSAADSLTTLDRSSVSLDAERCLHAVDKFNTCEKCFSICPVDAIEQVKPPVLDEDKCENCYACLVSCPMGAYLGKDAVRSLLLTTNRLEATRLELFCKHNPFTHKKGAKIDTSVQVRGCLAGLGSGPFLALRSMGVEQVSLRVDACRDCKWSQLATHIEHEVAKSQQLLAMWGYDQAITTNIGHNLVDRQEDELVWDADNPPLSRRGLFKMLSHEGQEVFARLALKSAEPDRRRPSLNQLRIAQAVELLGKNDVESPATALPDLGLASLTVTIECTACGSCTQVCPTRALKLITTGEEENLSYTLEFTPISCVACEACVHVCYPDAIRVNSAPTYKDIFGSSEPVTLRSGHLCRCQKCHQAFAQKAEEQLCPLCTYRTENPFGTKIPPTLLNQIAAGSEQKILTKDKR